jgi:hypothetical protein
MSGLSFPLMLREAWQVANTWLRLCEIQVYVSSLCLTLVLGVFLAAGMLNWVLNELVLNYVSAILWMSSDRAWGVEPFHYILLFASVQFC